MNQHVGDDTHEDAVGDAVGQGHHDDADEAGNAGDVVGEVHLAHLVHHHHADQNQSRSGSLGGNGEEEGGEEQSHSEAERSGDAGETRTAADVDAGSALDIGGHGGGAEHGAYGGADGISHEGLAQTPHIALLVDHAGAVGNAQEGADGVEHVDEEECEHADGHIHSEHVVPLKLPEDGLDGRRHGDNAVEVGDAQGDAHNGGDENADEQRARNPLDQQSRRQQNAADGQQDSGIVEIAQREERSLGRSHDAGALEADEGDEETDARADGATEHKRNGLDNLLAHAREGEQHEDDALNEDGRQSELPGVAHRDAHGEGEEGVQAHAGSQRERQLGVEGHDGGGHNGGDAGGGEHGALIHAGGGENAGVHGQNVGHREEGGDAADDLLADSHRGGVKTEEFLQHNFLN